MRRFSSSGFTLIEFLVVMAIIVSLVAVALPRMSGYNKDQALPQAADQLQSALRMTQTNATSGVKCLTEASQTWYLTLNDQSSYAIGSTCQTTTPTPVPSPVSSSVNVVSVDIDGCSGPITSGFAGVGVVFKNIIGSVSFLQGSSFNCSAAQLGNAKKMTITLQLGSDAGKQSKIVVERGGAIYVSSQ